MRGLTVQSLPLESVFPLDSLLIQFRSRTTKCDQITTLPAMSLVTLKSQFLVFNKAASEGSLFDKSSCSAAALGEDKFPTIILQFFS